MKPYRVTLIPGDGIGPEVTEVARTCVEATGTRIEWEVVEAGASVMDQYGTPLPDHVIESIIRNKVAWKGPITTPVGGGFRSVNVALRKRLDLYMCLRPCKTYQGVKSPYENIDLVVVRENTEDLYAGVEFDQHEAATGELLELVARSKGVTLPSDSAVSLKPISPGASRRIVDAAFRYAVDNHRHKVTAVHKANIMKYSDGLFSRTAREVAIDYQGEIEFEERLVDNMCMQLVQKPWDYDVLVLPNLYGDIISDLCAGLVGGLGVAPGANIGDEVAVFEPTHGSAPKYRGMDKVNPMAMILSGVLLLRYLGEDRAAMLLEEGLAAVISEGREVTYDLRPFRNDPEAVGTRAMGEAVVRTIKESQASL